MNKPVKPDAPSLPLAGPPPSSLLIVDAMPVAGDDEEPWTNGKYGADWCRAGDDVVVAEQPAIAIYENPHGAVVIRQRDSMDTDDHSIIIQPANLAAIISRLSDYLPRKGDS